jgi:hypothetical protein
VNRIRPRAPPGDKNHVQRHEDNRRDEKRQRLAEIWAGAQNCITRGYRRVDQVRFHRAETQQKNNPLPDVIPPGSGLDVAQEKIKRQQQKKAAEDVLVKAGNRNANKKGGVLDSKERR